MIVTIIYDETKNPDGSYRSWDPGTWAVKHCPSYITNGRNPNEFPDGFPRIDYYFSDERDALAFSLRWA